MLTRWFWSPIVAEHHHLMSVQPSIVPPQQNLRASPTTVPPLRMLADAIQYYQQSIINLSSKVKVVCILLFSAELPILLSYFLLLFLASCQGSASSDIRLHYYHLCSSKCTWNYVFWFRFTVACKSHANGSH